MANNLKFTSDHPGHIVYLIDLSESMGWENNKRINMLLDVLYKVLDDMIADNTPDTLHNRVSVTIIGYNTDIVDLFSGDLIELDKYLDKHNPLFDINAEAKPRWQTFMADAFDAAGRDIKKWIEKQEKGGIAIPAPIVINITDGIPEEGEKQNDPTHAKAMARAKAAAKRLKDISVPDGNVLLFNIHIGEGKGAVLPNSIPSSDSTNLGIKFLFEISSTLNGEQIETARRTQIDEAQPGSRFMAFGQTDRRKLFRLIKFGSKVSQVNSMTERVKPQ